MVLRINTDSLDTTIHEKFGAISLSSYCSEGCIFQGRPERNSRVAQFA